MEKWPGVCHGMMGLHPCHVDGDFEDALSVIKNQLDNPPNGKSFIAVGEIGMDLYWDKTYIEQQKLAFIEQCSWAKERNLLLSSMFAIWEELFETMDKVNDDELYGCFTVSQEAKKKQRARYGGFLLGIGGLHIKMVG